MCVCRFHAGKGVDYLLVCVCVCVTTTSKTETRDYFSWQVQISVIKALWLDADEAAYNVVGGYRSTVSIELR